MSRSSGRRHPLPPPSPPPASTHSFQPAALLAGISFNPSHRRDRVTGLTRPHTHIKQLTPPEEPKDSPHSRPRRDIDVRPPPVLDHIPPHGPVAGMGACRSKGLSDSDQLSVAQESQLRQATSTPTSVPSHNQPPPILFNPSHLARAFLSTRRTSQESQLRQTTGAIMDVCFSDANREAVAQVLHYTVHIYIYIDR